MAVDKLVDSTQLESGLTAIADAIRAKTGKSASMQFPGEFVSEIGSISGSEVENEDGLINGTLTTYENVRVTKIDTDVFSYNNSIVSISLPNVTSLSTKRATAIKYNPNLEHVYLPKLSSVYNSMNGCFQGNPKLQAIALPSRIGVIGGSVFHGDTALSAVDLGPDVTQAGGAQAYYNCTALKTLVIRRTSIATIVNVNCFQNSSFASNGTGGTIYIPKVLYDELGTGSSLDYKAATNWSTIDAYGTITWAQIEGSIYETEYADGTPILTT